MKCKKRPILISSVFLALSMSIIAILFQIQGMEKYSEESDIIVDVSNLVEMYVLEDTVNSKGAIYCIKSNCEEWISFEPVYYIERYIMGKWYRIPKLQDTMEYPAIEYNISINEEQLYNIGWSQLYGELSSGKYRVIKKMKQHGNVFFVAAEFYVKGEVCYEK